MRREWSACVMALLLFGCGDDPQSPGVEATSGDELPPDEGDGMARAMPAGQTSSVSAASGDKPVQKVQPDKIACDGIAGFRRGKRFGALQARQADVDISFRDNCLIRVPNQYGSAV